MDQGKLLGMQMNKATMQIITRKLTGFLVMKVELNVMIRRNKKKQKKKKVKKKAILVRYPMEWTVGLRENILTLTLYR